MNDLNEQLVKMLMESYDRGVADTKAAALEALLKGMDIAVKAEREACAKVCEAMSGPIEVFNPKYVHYIDCAAAIRARGKE